MSLQYAPVFSNISTTDLDSILLVVHTNANSYHEIHSVIKYLIFINVTLVIPLSYSLCICYFIEFRQYLKTGQKNNEEANESNVSGECEKLMMKTL